MDKQPIPRRSLLFVPADNGRAVEKAQIIPTDVIIFDLEDAVSHEHKPLARQNVIAAMELDYGFSELVVRVNPASTKAFDDDIKSLKDCPNITNILLPKAEAIDDIEKLHRAMPNTKIWANLETPKGILNAEKIASHPFCTAIVAGTNDLYADLHAKTTPNRNALLYALSHLIMVARAYDCLVFDGTYNEIGNLIGLRDVAIQGLMLGFDGKALIHPEQVPVVNEVFAPSADDIIEARQIVQEYSKAESEGKAVIRVSNQMIEALHYRRAKHLLEMNKSISKRDYNGFK